MARFTLSALCVLSLVSLSIAVQIAPEGRNLVARQDSALAVVLGDVPAAVNPADINTFNENQATSGSADGALNPIAGNKRSLVAMQDDSTLAVVLGDVPAAVDPAAIDETPVDQATSGNADGSLNVIPGNKKRDLITRQDDSTLAVVLGDVPAAVDPAAIDETPVDQATSGNADGSLNVIPGNKKRDLVERQAQDSVLAVVPGDVPAAVDPAEISEAPVDQATSGTADGSLNVIPGNKKRDLVERQGDSALAVVLGDVPAAVNPADISVVPEDKATSGSSNGAMNLIAGNKRDLTERQAQDSALAVVLGDVPAAVNPADISVAPESQATTGTSDGALNVIAGNKRDLEDRPLVKRHSPLHYVAGGLQRRSPQLHELNMIPSHLATRGLPDGSIEVIEVFKRAPEAFQGAEDDDLE